MKALGNFTNKNKFLRKFVTLKVALQEALLIKILVNVQEYYNDFPNGKYILQVSNKKNWINVKIANDLGLCQF